MYMHTYSTYMHNTFFLRIFIKASSRIEGGVFEQLNASNAQYLEVNIILRPLLLQEIIYSVYTDHRNWRIFKNIPSKVKRS